MICSIRVDAQAGTDKEVALYQSVDVSRALMTRALPLKLKSLWHHESIMLLSFLIFVSQFKREQSTLPMNWPRTLSGM